MSLTTDGVPPALVQPAFAPGTVIANRYRIEMRLGAGGGGTVFRCVDQRLGAVVALKVVASDGDMERLRREVAMARQITDRNVCRVHDLGETAELRFVTMELVEGANLRSKIRPGLPAAEARALIEQLVAGVAAIHTGGVVHRDLKPENVVVAPDGRAVIVDFGLAKTPSNAAATLSMRTNASSSPQVTEAGMAVGTPRYMSPEQAAGEAVDARTDVWSLGLVAHELLTGALPELDTTGAMVAPSVDQVWPGFAAILRGCFSLDPAERFADANMLRAAIAQLPASAASSAAPPEVWQSQPSVTNVTVASRPSRPRDPRNEPPSNATKEPVVPARRARWPIFLAAIGASAVIGFAVVRSVRSGDGSGSGSGSDSPVPAPGPRVIDGPAKMEPLTTTTTQWPQHSPTSVALDPTAKKLAFTTGGGKVYVRDAAGAAVEWSATVMLRAKPLVLGTPRVVGWFSDGTLAILGTTASAMHLIRLRADGSSEILHEGAFRVRAAVSPRGDRIALAQRASIATLEATSKTLAQIPPDDRVVALAWSTDGTQLAWMRVTPTAEAVLEITGIGEIWRGRTELLIDPLLTFAGTRVAFSFRDRGRTSIAVIDPATRKLTTFEELAGHVGGGNAVGGMLVLVRGPLREAVQIRDRFATRTMLGHSVDARGSHVAGWTTAGTAVYRVDDRVVAGRAGATNKSWQIDTWPGTQPADLPTAIIGDDVLVRRDDGDAWIVERLTAAGTRTRFGRYERATAIRCAASCVIQQRDGGDATWTELDAASGALGKLVHRRRATETPSFTLSRDGALLVITGQADSLTAIERATGDAVTLPSAAPIATHWSSVAIDDAGDLWATAVELDAHPFGLVRFRKTADSFSRTATSHVAKTDALRWLLEPHIRGSEGDLRIAVATRELHLEIRRADGF